MASKSFNIYYHDAVKCIESLFNEPELCNSLLIEPERHYHNAIKEEQLYHEMNTGHWWWEMQVQVTQFQVISDHSNGEIQKLIEQHKPGATIAPVILLSDKTQVTQFRSKQAYPLYLMISNIPKHLCCKPSQHTHILLAYLPTTRLEHITNQSSCQCSLANLFHTCMSKILCPLRQAGINGVEMASGDGVVQRVHLIIAVYACDYPEQVLITCTKTGDCPKCLTKNAELGSIDSELKYRDIAALCEISKLADKDMIEFLEKCEEHHIKPVYHPFWADLPYVDIYCSIAADVLHQIFQGIIKHTCSWITEIYDPIDIDACCCAFLPNHHIRIFSKGISSLSQLTGQEHGHICHILLGLLIAAPLPDCPSPAWIIRAIQALLDFTYLAQLPLQSMTTLTRLQNVLLAFHENIDVFTVLGI
ncbi:hypothetical protein APHAL10511_005548 [Amanita phalloides]|nr:hypothetical protein APHAL10511_005548 [Amanita phalloides]